jgi:hypothetical protein
MTASIRAAYGGDAGNRRRKDSDPEQQLSTASCHKYDLRSRQAHGRGRLAKAGPRELVRLRAELYFVHRALSHAVVMHRWNMLDDLHTEAAGTSVLIWRSCTPTVSGSCTARGWPKV